MRFTCPPMEIAPLLSTVILADDLTGACDSAAAFAACGLETRVALERFPEQVNAQVVAYSLDARNLEPTQIAQRMRMAMKRSSGRSAGVLFCKIDSAGRGPMGEMVLSALDASEAGWAVMTPAFPDQGRTVKNGTLEIAGGDSVSRRIAMKQLFPRGSEDIVGLIGGDDPEGCERQMRMALDAGRRVLICDAESREDIATMVEAARQMDRGPVLWCGSAGLARALAQSHYSQLEPTRDAVRAKTQGEICLLFTGTPHGVTTGQIEVLAGMGGVEQLEGDGARNTPISECRCAVAAVRCGDTSDAQIRGVWEQVQDANGVRALILTGGDTASMVLRALGAEAIQVRGEIESGIPWGMIEGGIADGYPVVTKSGGFGQPTSLVEIVRYLEQNS